jgi:3-dehydroquinate synthase
MIDSSIGGKTGVDLPAGKNLVGAFHHPRFVLADVASLATLARNQVAAGCAEAIKHGVVADAAYADAVGRSASACLARSLDALQPIIERSIRIKGEIVAADALEGGRRQVLNFGHTVGHAVEAATTYGRYLHGEAVAIGMVAAARVSHALGICDAGTVDRIRGVLRALGLPTDLPVDVPPAALVTAMRADKKSSKGRIRFVAVEQVGRVRFVELTAHEIAQHL